MLDLEAVGRCVRRALEEDLGTGDVTSRAVVPEGARAVGRFVAREPLVVAGLPVAREVFRRVGAGLAFETPFDDGADCPKDTVLATVLGEARPLLEGERTALNFLQRLSGIATATRALVDRVRGTRLQIADTRKTVPGLRVLDKYAVAVGGGTNHRVGLFDAWLIKDNHWRLAGGVGPALQRARAALGSRPAPGLGLEIEVGTLEEVREALDAGADALLLDNMDEETLQRAVEIARGRAFLEVSGNVRPERLEALARLGVDRVSFGALTHSVRGVDIALEVEGA
ncbi:MAG TPA: carboxylating nicotinate-nucleotide diphosphorylase [Candidatus Polarisedimenticolia bacterium]|jgi:nicotinate-nucleotide pyrophosphorylase (carboxylating)|nr:carboxylating nicotinate-nucleotide diphosphorylase [Candidatus Polarisedimenticolia bacterium]